MKKLITLFLLASITLASCTSKEDNNDEDNTPCFTYVNSEISECGVAKLHFYEGFDTTTAELICYQASNKPSIFTQTLSIAYPKGTHKFLLNGNAVDFSNVLDNRIIVNLNGIKYEISLNSGAIKHNGICKTAFTIKSEDMSEMYNYAYISYPNQQ
ncbi:hypothetical protein [Flavobacterium sp. A45]|uniref:hypothetical protein n=1 Tax=Flavobacterium sp. A45 TaxID=1945862 RepID=UPI0009849F79|nr:hypothetical protein [Flavobacterium sp. A45]OOG66801.1 hypothetical protein B0E44_14730 [Flavobacterium sp. A45]